MTERIGSYRRVRLKGGGRGVASQARGVLLTVTAVFGPVASAPTVSAQSTSRLRAVSWPWPRSRECGPKSAAGYGYPKRPAS